MPQPTTLPSEAAKARFAATLRLRTEIGVASGRDDGSSALRALVGAGCTIMWLHAKVTAFVPSATLDDVRDVVDAERRIAGPLLIIDASPERDPEPTSGSAPAPAPARNRDRAFPKPSRGTTRPSQSGTKKVAEKRRAMPPAQQDSSVRALSAPRSPARSTWDFRRNGGWLSLTER
ncbi:hypothetical protein [Xylanimonas ulmi]|uniref:hypothetical protein n=1 Tax=Xylanimonas ulmi TaxID=228973 RepID=UPI00102B2814|nr:hypothetical protein [Xylanibacterium ulmi]